MWHQSKPSVHDNNKIQMDRMHNPGAEPGGGASGARPPKMEKIRFFGVKS
jgi:hypothetical protein